MTEPSKDQRKEEEIFELNEETLKIIGKEPLKNQRELEVHSSLASRWSLWLQNELKKEKREKLLTKHPTAGDCSLELSYIQSGAEYIKS